MNKIIFILIQILLFPITLIGYIILVVFMFIKNKKQKVSLTATNPLITRYMLNELNVRDDPIAKLIVENLSIISVPALKTFYFPLVFGMKLTGYIPVVFQYSTNNNTSILSIVNSRTEFFDRVFQTHISEVSQVVIMGAGFDTRCFIFNFDNIKYFEIDLPETQKMKKELLETMNIPLNHITFISMDFDSDNWTEKLIQAGFDSSKKTLFLWEGVTLYLSKEVVKQTILDIEKITPKDSILTFDLYSHSFIKNYYKNKTEKLLTEKVIFGVDLKNENTLDLENLLKDSGFFIFEHRFIGDPNDKNGYISIDTSCKKV